LGRAGHQRPCWPPAALWPLHAGWQPPGGTGGFYGGNRGAWGRMKDLEPRCGPLGVVRRAADTENSGFALRWSRQFSRVPGGLRLPVRQAIRAPGLGKGWGAPAARYGEAPCCRWFAFSLFFLCCEPSGRGDRRAAGWVGGTAVGRGEAASARATCGLLAYLGARQAGKGGPLGGAAAGRCRVPGRGLVNPRGKRKRDGCARPGTDGLGPRWPASPWPGTPARARSGSQARSWQGTLGADQGRKDAAGGGRCAVSSTGLRATTLGRVRPGRVAARGRSDGGSTGPLAQPFPPDAPARKLADLPAGGSMVAATGIVTEALDQTGHEARPAPPRPWFFFFFFFFFAPCGCGLNLRGVTICDRAWPLPGDRLAGAGVGPPSRSMRPSGRQPKLGGDMVIEAEPSARKPGSTPKTFGLPGADGGTEKRSRVLIADDTRLFRDAWGPALLKRWP